MDIEELLYLFIERNQKSKLVDEVIYSEWIISLIEFLNTQKELSSSKSISNFISESVTKEIDK